MRKSHFSSILFLFLFFCTTQTAALQVKFHQFRMRNYVYYQILYKVKGIPTAEFEKVVVISETPRRFEFEYGGLRYTAVAQSAGSILVYMPEGNRDRVLWRVHNIPLILSTYRNY